MPGPTQARRTAVLAVAALLAALAGGVPAAAAPEEESWSDLLLSAAAVQPYRQFDQSVTDYPLVSLGYSGVVLRGDPGCMATGAGYWLGDGMERYGPMRSGPSRPKVKNPTAANVVRPQPVSAWRFDWTDAEPWLSTPGMRVTAWCAEDGHAGRAGCALREGAGPHLAGSATTATHDRAGTFHGTARSFVQDAGLTAGGTISSLTSLLHIGWPAGAAEPAVTYRLTLAEAAGGAGTRAGADSATVTLAGTHVPAHRLAAQFAEQRQSLAGPLASLAELTVIGPAVSTTGEDRYVTGDYAYLITAPSVVVRSALGPTTHAVGRLISYEPQQPSLTSENGLRLGAATFTAHRGRPRGAS